MRNFVILISKIGEREKPIGSAARFAPPPGASICCCLALSQVLFDGVLCQQSARILVEPASLDLTVKRVVRVDSVGGLLAVRERKGA